MKLYDVCEKYHCNYEQLREFLIDNALDFKKEGIFSEATVPDDKVEEYVKAFKEDQVKMLQRKKEEQAEAERKKKVMAEMLISSGFNFDGYKIVKYSGYISGDDAVQIPRSGVFGGNHNGSNLTDALVKIRRQALIELKEAAYNLGCNAVIGVDFDYITLEPETANLNGGTTYEPYVICVTANGNAVVVERDN